MPAIKYYLAEGQPDLRRASAGASGYDLRASMPTSRAMLPDERWQIRTGLHLEMPLGVEGQIRSRSGLAANHGVIVLNAPGTIDSDYRGEIIVTLLNTGRQIYEILHGDRIAQIVFAPVLTPGHARELFSETMIDEGLVRVPSLHDLGVTDRHHGRHGSTGR